LTKNFDAWSERGVTFVFGYDAKPNLRTLAEGLPSTSWSKLRRRRKHRPSGPRRRKRGNVKGRLVKELEFENLVLQGEEIAEFSYRPRACKRDYRMIVLRKSITHEKGQQKLFDETRYLFYITNERKRDMSASRVVFEANDRCNQENLIEQLKHEVRALHSPVHDLTSNWAYMVIASFAWTLKAWFALTLPRREDQKDVLSWEFRRFVESCIRVPCKVTMSGRRTHVDAVGYTDGVRLLLDSQEAISKLELK
jgi:hypothetical protein